MEGRTVYLCAGLQSSGSTLVSWCFLQRPDMDGVLDAAFDSVPVIPAKLSGELPWCKFTIACFQFADVQQHLEDDGWAVRPLLVTRDVRAVFNSLVHKKYGRNGTTADDPPLRMRLRRFHRDWQMFQQRGWPIMRYEDLAKDPRGALQKTCADLGLPWHEAMATWPKSVEQIADPTNGNMTFAGSRASTLEESIKSSLAEVKTKHIPPADLEWMEREFADMNAALGYPLHVPLQATDVTTPRAIPNFECTRRHSRLRRIRRLQRRRRVLWVVGMILLALLVLADAKNWIRCIDFF